MNHFFAMFQSSSNIKNVQKCRLRFSVSIVQMARRLVESPSSQISPVANYPAKSNIKVRLVAALWDEYLMTPVCPQHGYNANIWKTHWEKYTMLEKRNHLFRHKLNTHSLTSLITERQWSKWDSISIFLVVFFLWFRWSTDTELWEVDRTDERVFHSALHNCVCCHIELSHNVIITINGACRS